MTLNSTTQQVEAAKEEAGRMVNIPWYLPWGMGKKYVF